MNDSKALAAVPLVLCHVNMLKFVKYKTVVGLFSVLPEGSETSVHNTRTHMEVISRFIPSGVCLVPHAGAISPYLLG